MLESGVIVLFSLTLFRVATTSGLNTYIKALVFQGLLLFIITSAHFGQLGTAHYLFLGFETLIVKGIITPYFISVIIDRIEIKREAEPYLDNLHSLFITIIIIIISFIISLYIQSVDPKVNYMPLSVSIAALTTGLFIITSRRKIITHVMGYLIFENGIFLMAITTTRTLPIIIEIGVLLDIFVGILLMGIFINRLKSTTDTLDHEDLARLTDL